MFKRLKLLMKLKFLKVKMDLFEKKYKASKKKTNKWNKKLSEATIKWAYANEHLHPETTWEMRAEREFERLNL